ncbi:MAG: alpha/beta hydrolase [Stellaceae bacterium]
MTEYEAAIKPDILYAVHDGVELLGDLYYPQVIDRAPVLVAVHGGGFQLGDRKFYRYWGPYLARHGYALFSIEYRLMKPGVKTWPGAAYDTKAAVQFVRANAAELDLDPERIAFIGDSAGAYLASLVALSGAEPLLSSDYRGDPNAAVSSNVKAVIAFYGVYDMAAQWEHDQITRPRDQITEKFLGCTPMVSRKVFFDASPLSYATVGKNTTRFLLIYGREDDIVDPVSQSDRFLTALKQAGFFARHIVVPGAGHFWASDPVDEPGSFGAYVGPRLLHFLAASL